MTTSRIVQNYGKRKVENLVKGNWFCITGTLNSARTKVSEKITRAGGSVTTTVTSRTDCLVRGDKPGRSKLDDAKCHRVLIIDEQELDNMLKIIEKHF